MIDQEISTRIDVDSHSVVFVDQFDEDVWLSIQVRNGSANCVMTKAQARKLIEALTQVVEAE